MCMIFCEHGPALDENGCPLPCSCALKPEDIKPEPIICKPCLTALACHNGFLLDEYGCSTCQCNF